MNDANQKHYNSMDSNPFGYLDRESKATLESGLTRVTGERKLVCRMPDEWDFRYDAQNKGEEAGFFKTQSETEGWQKVRTFSSTLNGQQVPEQLTWMWYRTTFTAPEDLPSGPLHIWFGEVDGSPTKVWLNGEPAGEFKGTRKHGEVEVSGKVLAGKENVLVIRTGQLAVSEVMQGGIFSPVMIYSGSRPR